MNKLTIQINSLDALERLIGGDAEVEIDIRQSVVERFVRKHLKGIANETLIKKAVEDVQKYVAALLLEEIKGGQGHWWSGKSVLTEAAKNLLRDHARDLMDTEVRGVVLAEMKTSDIVKKVTALLETQAQFIVDQLSNDILEERLEGMVNKRLKEKLGIT